MKLRSADRCGKSLMTQHESRVGWSMENYGETSQDSFFLSWILNFVFGIPESAFRVHIFEHHQ